MFLLNILKNWLGLLEELSLRGHQTLANFHSSAVNCQKLLITKRHDNECFNPKCSSFRLFAEFSIVKFPFQRESEINLCPLRLNNSSPFCHRIRYRWFVMVYIFPSLAFYYSYTNNVEVKLLAQLCKGFTNGQI